MTHPTDHATPPQVPAEMVATHKRGWHEFTRFMLWNALATAALLLVLLLVFRVF